MLERAPSARVVGPGVLRGYSLKWHKSGRDGSGKCDVVVEPQAAVHGVLYEILPAEKHALDRAEGLGSGYDEQWVHVEHQGKVVCAYIYRASSLDPSLAPYGWYKALVLAGARQHCLPAEYIAALEAVAARVDPDAQRHARNMALATRSA